MSTKIRCLHISLPIADLMNSMLFYRDVFCLELVGEHTEDGVPEPLVFRVDHRTLLALIPADGLGGVLGDSRELALAGTSECLIGVGLATEQEVTDLVERIRGAGGEVLAEPEHKPWGYTALCADPDGHVWEVGVDPSPER